MPADAEQRIAALEARVGALGALVGSTLTTLMLRGLLTRAEIAPLLAEAEALVAAAAGSSADAARSELAAIGIAMPDHLRKAMGPAPTDDDHDH